MNIVSSLRPDAGGPTSLRAQSKLKTRRRVLDAARALFMERGYEAATIRDIAAEAGLSTGAVFASFLDKTDLFNAVMAEDFQRLIDRRPQELLAAEPDVDKALLLIFTDGYGFHSGQLPLLQAAISLSWSHGLGGEFGDRPSYSLAMEYLATVLKKGIERGQLAGDIDVRLTAEVLWDTYVANYRRALFDSWTVEQLTERSRQQIALILRGLRA
jgi:AcrR family transcriptional regulator